MPGLLSWRVELDGGHIDDEVSGPFLGRPVTMDLSGRVHCPNGVNVCRNGIESCHKHRPLSRTIRLRPPVRDGPVFVFRWGSDSVKYAKPHIPYDQQVALLRSRGLAVEDPERAIQDLKRIGYYRLSGYLYPFRRIDPERQATGKRTRPQRLDSFVDGASLEDGVRLHDFDHRLAQVLLDGIQQIEIGLRVKIGYVLGKHGPFAHLDTAELGPQALQEHRRIAGRSRYDVWRREYDDQQAKAERGKHEFVLHFVERYNGEVPIWAATEFMTMGCLVSLLGLMERKDQRTIARELSLKNQDVLRGWLRPLNVLRNHCAHGNRVWNRPVVFQSDRLNLNMLSSPDFLAHLEASSKAPVDHRVYFHSATAAYLLKAINPNTSWPTKFVEVMTTFPHSVEALGLSAQTMMGFPEDWRREDLWN